MADSSQPANPRSWQGPRGAASRTSDKQARLRKIIILAAVILVLAGAIAGLLFYLREPPLPTLVVLRIDQNDPRFPVSPWAAQDREALNLGEQKKNTFTSQQKTLLLQELDKIGNEQEADQPLVIYLGAFAAVKEDGVVAVLPADARLNAPDTWLPFKDILDSLRKSPVKNRLLLLDLGLPCVDPQAGLLAANVPQRLKPVLETAVKDDPNLQILVSCAPGQISLASEELGHTVFVHYLTQGLAGRADGFLSKQPDNRVTVAELVEYVKMQVDRWAYHNTGLRQTPEYFGTGKNLELTGTEGKKPPAIVSLASEYPSFLHNGWVERDRWWTDRAGRTPPELIAQLEHLLLDADERWRQGGDAAKVESELKSYMKRVQDLREKSLPPPDRTEPGSLAEAVARGQKTPEGSVTEWLRQLRELGNLWALVKQPKATDKPSDMDRARLPMEMEKITKKYDKPFDLSWVIFQAALKDTDLRQEHVRCWCDLLRAEGKPLPNYQEIRFLQKLADLPVAKPDDWPPAVGVALQLVELVEKVETLKPRTQPWLVAEYAEARKRRERAEMLLFSNLPAERLVAGVPVNEALSAFGELQQHLLLLNDAHRTRDEALVFLPGYVSYLDHDPTKLDVWLAAVQTTRTLRDILAKTPEADKVLSQLRQAKEKTSALQTGLRKMTDPVRALLDLGPISDSRPLRAADAMEMRALLRLPSLSAKDRKTIWTRARETTGRLNKEALERESSTDTLPPPDEARAIRQELDRALVRAHASQGLLRLEGSPDVEKVDVARERVVKTPQDETAWEKLRTELREAWRRHEGSKP